MSRLARLAPVAAGLLMLAFYLATMPHGLTWDLGGADGGELATGVYTLGLVHPPGYPTYLLLAQAARLVPVASFAWKLNVFSALCAAGAVVLVGYTASRVIAGDGRASTPAFLTGALAGLAFGLIEVVWTQAIITEVYALAALVCAALLWLAFHADATPDDRAFTRRLAAFGLVAGLGPGSHYMVGLVMLFAVGVLFRRGHRPLARRGNLLALLAFLLGLAVFAYLPLRAGAVPLSNWGDPDTPARFVQVVTAADYAGRFRPGLAAARLAPLIGVLVRQLSLPGMALALLGLSVWWDTRRPLLVAAAITITLNLVLVAGYDSADTLPYLYPTLLLLVLTLAEAVYRVVFTWLPEQRWARGLAAAGLAALVLAPLAVRGANTTARVTTEADAFGREVVSSAPPNSVILSEDEALSFAIRYAAVVSVGRADVVPIDTCLLALDWFRRDMAEAYPALGLDAVDPSALDVASVQRALPPGVPVVIVTPPAAATGD